MQIMEGHFHFQKKQIDRSIFEARNLVSLAFLLELCLRRFDKRNNSKGLWTATDKATGLSVSGVESIEINGLLVGSG